MRIMSISKPTALAAAFALALSSTAFGQTMVGSQEISEEDMPLVTEHCASLTSADAMGTADTDPTATDTEADATATDTMAAEPGAMDAPDADTADADGGDDEIVDLASITAEDCEAAGIATQ